MKNLILLVLPIIFLAACNQSSDDLATLSSGNLSSRSPLQEREISGEIYSTVDLDPLILTPCSGDIPGFALPDQLLDGQALHLGNLNGELSTLHHDACDLSFATALLTTTVSGSLVAANGDELYYSGDDVINVANLLTSSGTTGSITGTWYITGGTGRFDEASGDITIEGVVDFVSGTFQASLEGTVKY